MIDTEYVIKKDSDFRGIPYSILHYGVEWWTGKPRSNYETDEYEILSCSEYDKKVEAFCEEFCGNWKETTEQQYNEMLNILPPLKWTRGGFFVSEGYTLDIHRFYQEIFDRYYEAYFRINTPRDEILKSLYGFINSQEMKAGRHE